MHEAEAERDRGDTRQCAAHHRQQAEEQQARRAIGEEQQPRHHRGRQQREARRVPLDRGARPHREDAGPGLQQARLPRARHIAPGAGEILVHLCQRLLLGIDIEAFGTGLHHQKSAAFVAREPDAVPRIGPRRSREPVDESEDLAGGIGRQAALHQDGEVRAEELQIARQRLVQPRDGEAFGTHAGAEQIAVPPHPVALGGGRDLLAVVDRDKVGPAAQALGKRPAQRRQVVRRRAFDADKNEPRDNAVAHLIDQRLLPGRGRAREKRRHVGAQLGAGDHQDAGGKRHDPDCERGVASDAH